MDNNEPSTSWTVSIPEKVGSAGPMGVGALLITLGIAAFTSGAQPLTIAAVAGLIAVATVSIIFILGRWRATHAARQPSGTQQAEIDEPSVGGAVRPDTAD